MQSPFPGMDPFIEGCGLWEDFHTHLIGQISDTLAEAAPVRYIVRAGERSYVVLVDSDEKAKYPFLPDVRISAPKSRKSPRLRTGGAALAEPVDPPQGIPMRAFIEETFREAFIEIYTAAPEQRLVTCIEVLSPSNKRPGTPGWDLYQRKRQSLMLAGVNLVEIDLLRGGQRMPMVDAWPDAPFVLLVARAFREQSCKVWSATLQDRVPVIPVPLLTPDPHLMLDLQPMIDSIYRRFRYARSIDYRQALTPPLRSAESAWLKQQLKGRSRV
jgi:hypothetical protein